MLTRAAGCGKPQGGARPRSLRGRGARNLSWLGQVNVRLPEELSGAGDVTVTVNVRGAQSNGVPLRVD